VSAPAGTLQPQLRWLGATRERDAAAVAPAAGRGIDGLLLVAPGAIWGCSFLFIAEALQAVGPLGLTFLRILVGFATLAAVPAARRAVPRGAWPAIALLGVVWYAVPLSMFPFAEQRVSSAVTGMLNGAIPIFTALVEIALLRRLPSRRLSAGLVVGALGTVLIAWPTLHEGASSLVGILLIAVALVCYSFAPRIARPLQQAHGALPVIWRAQLVGLVLTAPLGLPQSLDATWSLRPLLCLLALGAFGTAVAYVLLTVGTGRLGPVRASGTAFLIPVVALALGVLVRGERISAAAIAGGAVCLYGAWMMRRAETVKA